MNHRLHPYHYLPNFLPGLVRSTCWHCQAPSSTWQNWVKLRNSSINHISTIHPPYIYHISTICQPYIYHISTTYLPHIYHISTIYQPYWVVYLTYQPYNNHISTYCNRTVSSGCWKIAGGRTSVWEGSAWREAVVGSGQIIR